MSQGPSLGTASFSLTELNGPLFECACTEGNYGMANILSGQRVAEGEAAKQESKTCRCAQSC
jgi:hypothetical protein